MSVIRTFPLASRIGFPAHAAGPEPEGLNDGRPSTPEGAPLSIGKPQSSSGTLMTVEAFLSLQASTVSKSIVAPEPSGPALKPA